MPKMSTQEAILRAYRFIRGFHGGDARAWVLQMLRNTSYTWLEKNRPIELSVEFGEELHQQPAATPASLAIAGDERERLIRALETLPPGPRFRQPGFRGFTAISTAGWHGNVTPLPRPASIICRSRPLCRSARL